MADSFLLDSLQLNDLTTFGVEVDGFLCPPPKQRREWIGAADSEHQTLVRDPLYENREITIPIAVFPQANVDLVFDKIGLVRDKLAKASKYPGGITLTWVAHGSSRTINFAVLAGEITELPLDWQSGFQALTPTFTVVLTCKPYWYGTETLGSTTSSSTPFVSAEIVNNSGDVPALGRLIVTDTATQSRRHVEWGLEGPLTYNSSTSLLIDSDNMVTSGFAGVQSTGAGAYDPNAVGNSLIATSLVGATVACCGTGNLSHVGSFRVKARVQATDTTVRLAWQAGDGPFNTNPWVQLETGTNWVEVDLGSITIPVALSGTQRWSGRIEATSGSAQNLYVDYLILVPTSDGYGKARAVYSYSPGVLTGFDQFTGTTAAGNLNARVATSGGTWATSGGAGDFQFADDFSGEQIKRSTTAGGGERFAVLGSSNFIDVDVSVALRMASFPGGTNTTGGVIARWVDSSNFLRVHVLATGTTPTRLFISQIVGGVGTALASIEAPAFLAGQFFTVRTAVFASGKVVAALLTSAGAVIATAEASSTVLATAGTLATGKPGIYDSSVAAIDRHYDDFQVATPPAEPIVLYSGRNMQFRYDDTFRQDSTGVYTGQPQSYHPAGRFLVPVGTSRVLVKARRNDVDVSTDPNVTDATQIQIAQTPRGLVVPRA